MANCQRADNDVDDDDVCDLHANVPRFFCKIEFCAQLVGGMPDMSNVLEPLCPVYLATGTDYKSLLAAIVGG